MQWLTHVSTRQAVGARRAGSASFRCACEGVSGWDDTWTIGWVCRWSSPTGGGTIQSVEGLIRTRRHSEGKFSLPDCLQAGKASSAFELRLKLEFTPSALLGPQLANYWLETILASVTEWANPFYPCNLCLSLALTLALWLSLTLVLFLHLAIQFPSRGCNEKRLQHGIYLLINQLIDLER